MNYIVTNYVLPSERKKNVASIFSYFITEKYNFYLPFYHHGDETETLSELLRNSNNFSTKMNDFLWKVSGALL